MKIPLFEHALHYGGRTWWAPLMVKQFERFIEKEDRVLDIGAGGGWVGELLARRKACNVTLLDVIDLNRSGLPLVRYDGVNIPFQERSFDTSLLLFVLHHCEDPLLVLQEAVRVSSKRIIIFEDTFISPWEKFLTCVHDFFSNFHFFIANPFKMNMPFHYRRVEEWEGIFNQFSLKLRFKKITQHFLTRHVLFILEKQ